MHHKITIDKPLFSEILRGHARTICRPAKSPTGAVLDGAKDELIAGDSVDIRCDGYGYEGWVIRAVVFGSTFSTCCDKPDRISTITVLETKRGDF